MHRALATASLLTLSLSACAPTPDGSTAGATSSALRDGREECRKDEHDKNPNPGIAPIHSEPHGQDYSAWAADWWTWALRQPTAVNPIFNDTPAACSVDQHGGVWFLAGNHGGASKRECDIPRGTALFFPLVNTNWVQFLTDVPQLTVKGERDALRPYFAGATATATIDGRAVVDPTSYYEESDVFTARYPKDNPFGIDSTICAPDRKGLLTCWPGVDIGYYLFVEPLSPGDHVIHFSGAIPNFGFALDVSYTLHVK